MRVEIRPADEESIRFVVDYCHRCGVPDGGSPPYEELLCRYLRRLQSGRYWCFIATSGGKPVGYVDLEVRRREGRDTLWIGELYVVPEHRRQRLGVTLVRHALSFASAHGWWEVHSTTEPDNPGGLGTLNRAGFVVVSAHAGQVLLRRSVRRSDRRGRGGPGRLPPGSI